MRRLLPLLLLVVPALAFAAPSAEEMALHQEIAALKLDRALNLSAQQAKALLPLLRQQAVVVQQMKTQHEQAKPAVLAALTRARDELKSTGTVSAQTEQAIRDAHGGMQGHGQFKQFHEQVKQILTPQQIESVKGLRLGAMQHGPMMEGGGFGGGWGEGEREAVAPRPGMAAGKGGGRHFGKGMFLHRVATSDAFIALVEARAR
jgi:hypothetical protein